MSLFTVHKGEAVHAPSPLQQVLLALKKGDALKRFGAKRQKYKPRARGKTSTLESNHDIRTRSGLERRDRIKETGDLCRPPVGEF
jgi:hypothetical protein